MALTPLQKEHYEIYTKQQNRIEELTVWYQNRYDEIGSILQEHFEKYATAAGARIPSPTWRGEPLGTAAILAHANDFNQRKEFWVGPDENGRGYRVYRLPSIPKVKRPKKNDLCDENEIISKMGA